MLKPLKLGNLEIKFPIFQGGMGIGVSLSKLAGAVGACGGVGVISAAHPGYKEFDFNTDSLQADIRALKRQIKEAKDKVKSFASSGAIGVNIMCAIVNYEHMVKASIEAGVDIIISGAGLPLSLPGFCKESKVKLIPIISSARAATLIIKTWKKRYSRTPDAVIFEGPAAGGHLGYKEEEIESQDQKFYETITEIKETISGFGEIPLIVGGGIRDKKDIEKVMSCGADAVQIGTRFVTTEECDASENYKKAYIDCTEEDIMIIKSPVGMPGRALRNTFTTETTKGRIVPKTCHNCLVTCKAADTPYCITEALIAAASGDVDNGLVFCGRDAYKSNKIETVSEIFEELTKEEEL